MLCPRPLGLMAMDTTSQLVPLTGRVFTPSLEQLLEWRVKSPATQSQRATRLSDILSHINKTHAKTWL